MRHYILDIVSDLCTNFLYYDRKEDEMLSRKQLKEAIEKGDVTIEELGEHFKKELTKGLEIL